MQTEEYYIKKIGKNIVKARENKGLNQADLAVKMDIESSSLGRIERGVTNPTVKMLARIATALDISIKEIIPE